MADGFYNSIKVLKETLQRTKQTMKTTKYTYGQTIIVTKKDIHKISTTSPLVYTNIGWLGDGSHRGQVRQAWTAVGLPPRYPQCVHQTEAFILHCPDELAICSRHCTHLKHNYSGWITMYIVCWTQRHRPVHNNQYLCYIMWLWCSTSEQ